MCGGKTKDLNFFFYPFLCVWIEGSGAGGFWDRGRGKREREEGGWIGMNQSINQ